MDWINCRVLYPARCNGFPFVEDFHFKIPFFFPVEVPQQAIIVTNLSKSEDEFVMNKYLFAPAESRISF
jgi:hypothetical protein